MFIVEKNAHEATKAQRDNALLVEAQLRAEIEGLKRNNREITENANRKQDTEVCNPFLVY